MDLRFFRVMLLCLTVFFYVASCSNIPTDLLDCVQRGKCGIESLCTFDVTASDERDSSRSEKGDEREAFYKNCKDENVVCTKEERDLYETWSKEYESFLDKGSFRTKGHVMVLSNGLDHVVDFSWDVISKDDADFEDERESNDETRPSLYKASVPKRGYVYLDTHRSSRHTVRLSVNGYTVRTEASADKTCTRHESCEYMMRICASNLIYVTDVTLESKNDCLAYSRACNFFSENIIVRKDGNPRYDDGYEEGNNGGGEEGRHSSGSIENDVGPLTNVNRGASDCLVDCVYSYYDNDILPSHEDGKRLLNSVDVVRRLKLGMSMDVKECDDDVKFVGNVNYDPFMTEEDYWKDPKANMMGRYGSNPRSNDTNRSLIAVSVALVLMCVLFLSFVVIYRNYIVSSVYSSIPWLNGASETKDDDWNSNGTSNSAYYTDLG